jgi:hypothetical protein
LQRQKRRDVSRILAALEAGPQTVYQLCDRIGDDPTYPEVLALLTTAQELGLVKVEGKVWRIVAPKRLCRDQASASYVLGVGSSTVSRWVAEGLMSDPPGYYDSEKGTVYPTPGQLLGQGLLPLEPVPVAPGPQPTDTGPPECVPVVKVDLGTFSVPSHDLVTMPTRTAAALALEVGLSTRTGLALAERVLRAVAGQ